MTPDLHGPGHRRGPPSLSPARELLRCIGSLVAEQCMSHGMISLLSACSIQWGNAHGKNDETDPFPWTDSHEPDDPDGVNVHARPATDVLHPPPDRPAAEHR